MTHPILRAAALALLLVLAPAPAVADQAQQGIESRIAAETYPMAVFVTGAGVETPHGFAAGMADARAGRALTVDTPMRIASNTKTFVAATVLRLWEQGRIDLDAAIGPLLTPSLDALLRADGFATDRITVRQLLSHSAGLYDHGSDPRFIEAVLADPAHVWTREEQVRASMTWADPQSPPGTEFRYSDTGYILLGDIVERITGKSLAQSVREQLHFDRLGLATTWWEIAEPAPAAAAPRLAQRLLGHARLLRPRHPHRDRRDERQPAGLPPAAHDRRGDDRGAGARPGIGRLGCVPAKAGTQSSLVWAPASAGARTCWSTGRP